MPTGVHPLVRIIFECMREDGWSHAAVETRAGIGEHTLNNWRRQYNPTLTALEAVLGALGYRLLAVKVHADTQQGRKTL